MPRRRVPVPLAFKVGQRIKQLREEQGLTMERLAFESGETSISKGHLSSIERGLVAPTIITLEALAERLGVEVLDLFTFPGTSERHELIKRSLSWKRGTIRKILKETEPPPEPAPESKPPSSKKPAKKRPKRRRVSGRTRAR